jgi:cyanophycinase
MLIPKNRAYKYLKAKMNDENTPTLGPENGWLIIQGGGVVAKEMQERFVALAGGPDANFVLIPTAMSDEEIAAGGFVRGQGRGWANSWGIKHVTMLHTRDRVRANSEGFVEPLRNASGVWIDGGRQWRLADAYLDTAVELEIKKLLARGGVVGGGSAGATIQGSFLIRGDPKGNEIMISPGHERGFGFLSNSAIDQHVNTRGRESDLDPVISQHPELLGIGIDENAAIIVHGNLFEVLGGQVAIHDGRNHDGTGYYFISPGQTFDLKTKAVARAATTESISRNIPTPAAPTGESQTSKYPIILTVTSATRTNHAGYTSTEIIGYRSDDPGQTQLHMVCDIGIFSRGPDGKANTYPARNGGKSHQLKIETRDIGSDKTHEHTCKY